MQQGTKRIEYIDAMRGFAMLLVVYSHIIAFSYSGALKNDIAFGGNDFLSFNALFILFRMPLFFFISGFLLYKNDFEWTVRKSLTFLSKKAEIQLVPTFLFLFIYAFTMDLSFEASCFSPLKRGYWFTIALFEFFLIYVTFRLICNLFRKKDGADWALLIVGIAIYCITSMPQFLQTVQESSVCGFLGLDSRIGYFLFFAIGTLAKKHFDQVQKLMDNAYFSGAILLTFFGITIFALHQGHVAGPIRIPYLLATGCLGVAIVFMFFRKYQASFASNTPLGRILQYVGRHTLDIYLLHYLFLPKGLNVVGQFFADYPNNQILELFLSLLLAILVIGICLLASNIIRLSPFLAHWLFGAKRA